jgi:hypothetical protein
LRRDVVNELQSVLFAPDAERFLGRPV